MKVFLIIVAVLAVIIIAGLVPVGNCYFSL